jgi:hypothetical protein
MSILDYSKVFDSDGKLNLSESVWLDLRQLAEIVLNTHHSYVSHADREDLISIAIIKGVELLTNNDFDSKRSSLKNYIYTGMRNEMTNHLYRGKKELPQDEFPTNNAAEEYDIVEVHYKMIVEVTKPFTKRCGDYAGLLCAYVERLGFSIVDKPTNIEILKDYNVKVLERLVCMILWKRREFSH